MFFSWFVVLTLFGLIAGWDQIHVLAWLLLIPFFIQDLYDSRN